MYYSNIRIEFVIVNCTCKCAQYHLLFLLILRWIIHNFFINIILSCLTFCEAEVGFVIVEKQARLETAFAFKCPSVTSVHKTNRQAVSLSSMRWCHRYLLWNFLCTRALWEKRNVYSVHSWVDGVFVVHTSTVTSKPVSEDSLGLTKIRQFVH